MVRLGNKICIAPHPNPPRSGRECAWFVILKPAQSCKVCMPYSVGRSPRGTETDPNPITQHKADSAVNWLYNEMSRVMQKAGN